MSTSLATPKFTPGQTLVHRSALAHPLPLSPDVPRLVVLHEMPGDPNGVRYSVRFCLHPAGRGPSYGHPQTLYEAELAEWSEFEQALEKQRKDAAVAVEAFVANTLLAKANQQKQQQAIAEQSLDGVRDFAQAAKQQQQQQYQQQHESPRAGSPLPPGADLVG